MGLGRPSVARPQNERVGWGRAESGTGDPSQRALNATSEFELYTWCMEFSSKNVQKGEAGFLNEQTVQEPPPTPPPATPEQVILASSFLESHHLLRGGRDRLATPSPTVLQQLNGIMKPRWA